MVAEVWGRGWERALLGEKCWKGPPCLLMVLFVLL